MLRFAKDLARDQRGSVLVYLTITFTAVIGAAALGAEGAYRLYTHRIVQSAADTAAYSASAAFGADSAATLDTIKAQARAMVAQDYNMVHGTGGVTVDVNNPPVGTCYSGTSHFTTSKAVEVIVTKTVAPILSVIWGVTSANICGRAVASLPGSGDCVLSLGSGASITSTKNGLTVNLTGCSIYSNGDIALSGNSNSITADTIAAVGTITSTGNHTSVSNPVQGAPPLADPYATVSATWPLTGGSDQTSKCPAPTTGNQGKGKGGTGTPGGCQTTLSLSPGTYTAGMNFNNPSAGATYTLAAGIYYVSGGDFDLSANQVTVNGTGGVTIVMTDNHVIKLSGQNPTLNITAPTSGTFNSVAIFEPTATGINSMDGNNASVNIVGLIYAPHATVQYGGNNSTTPACTQIVADNVSFNANSIYITATGCSAAGFTGLKTFGQIPQLVE